VPLKALNERFFEPSPSPRGYRHRSRVASVNHLPGSGNRVGKDGVSCDDFVFKVTFSCQRPPEACRKSDVIVLCWHRTPLADTQHQVLRPRKWLEAAKYEAGMSIVAVCFVQPPETPFTNASMIASTSRRAKCSSSTTICKGIRTIGGWRWLASSKRADSDLHGEPDYWRMHV
jgi:hypothetical protein